MDAAFFAGLEELRNRADRAVEEATALRATSRDIVQSRGGRGGAAQLEPAVAMPAERR
jgi:hypothetical protein